MKLNIKYSIKKDLENYIHKIYKSDNMDYGSKDEIKTYLIKTLDTSINQCLKNSPTEKDFIQVTKTFLEKFEKKNKENIKETIRRLNKHWGDVGNQVIYHLETLYSVPFPYNEITGFLTTIHTCPYSYKQKYTYMYIKTPVYQQVTSITHELNHFMFHHYFEEKLRKELSPKKFHILKESLTFFSNPTQEGYPKEQKLRELYMSRDWNNMDEIVENAVELIKKEQEHISKTE